MPNALRTQTFTESVIRAMTRLANQYGAVNLSQGFPDFPMPDAMKQAAIDAINADVNQYAITWGAKKLRDAITAKYQRRYDMPVDPEREITIACGATEATASVFLALFNPGDEVLVFEPFYENYGPDAILCEARPVYVPLVAPDWHFDEALLRKAITPKARAIVINSPHNPTGHVFSRSELETIARICIEHDLIAITDDPYEYIIYAGEHVPIATLPGMRERTVTISSLSKTFSITGWRIGYAIASPERSDAIRKVHDFLTVGAPAPLQDAAAVGYSFSDEYYAGLAREYRERRDFLSGALRQAGFVFTEPQGAYYLFTDFSRISSLDDMAFAEWLTKEIGIATVPGSSFYRPGAPEAKKYTRFAFCKRMETLERAVEKLERLK
ncbi:MAG TPA: aminotransferase class I/II-fold pyridoxal phosphate-dependent enzyme [Gemmatimonadaceae bacterium]|nr:aminotransferase class I/II-fold pyridoxal phosphate-dependent enzyme [Gemmatimonadaceae bacterium]